jgi:hypothetical protein
MGTYRSRDKAKEHVQKPMQICGGHEMICSNRSCVRNALLAVSFEDKERTRPKLDVVYYVPLDGGEYMGLSLELARLCLGCCS